MSILTDDMTYFTQQYVFLSENSSLKHVADMVAKARDKMVALETDMSIQSDLIQCQNRRPLARIRCRHKLRQLMMKKLHRYLVLGPGRYDVDSLSVKLFGVVTVLARSAGQYHKCLLHKFL